MLAVARRIVEGDRFVREGRWRTWDPSLLLGYDVAGAMLGIVGYGKIGRAVAQRAAGFGMHVIFTARADSNQDVIALPRTARASAASNGAVQVELDQLVRASDFVSLHVPLTDRTHRMIGEQRLRSMKRTAILVNTSRGGVVDQLALVRALTEGWIAGAGLDVAEVEPIPPGDALLRAPNVVLLPHVGSASHATRERMAWMAVDNCIAGIAGGRLPNCANPEVYDTP
jgi:glyoxylate reductase